MCLHKEELSCSGVTEDEMLSPLRQMEGCSWEGDRNGWIEGGSVDEKGGRGIFFFLRHTRMAVSGKATMSSHLTHNSI